MVLQQHTIELNDGHTLPQLGFGTYQIRECQVIEHCLDVCLVTGYRLFDTATIYRNESFIGKALKHLVEKHRVRRDEVFITTKINPSEQGEEKAYKAVLESLEKLELEYLDLVLIHWPGVAKVSLNQEEQQDQEGSRKRNLHKEGRHGSYKALQRLKAEGKVKSIGVSNFTVDHLNELLGDPELSIVPAVNQIEVHPHYYSSQQELISYCKEKGILVQAYSSLGTSPLNSTRNDLMEDETVKQIARQKGCSVASVLLLWAKQKGFGILPKSTNILHIIDNFEVLAKNEVALSEDEMTKLDSIEKEVKYCWDPAVVP